MKLKVIGLATASVFFIVLMVLAYQSMWADERPANTGNAFLDQDTPQNEAARVLQASDILYNSFDELQKANDNYTTLLIKAAGENEISGTQKKVSQAEGGLKNAIDKVEMSNTNLQSESAKNSMAHIISSYKLLLKFQSFENDSNSENSEVSTRNTDEPQTLQMQSELQKKDTRIAQLQKQIRLLQNSKNNTSARPVTPADYQELVSKNKYLNLDLRSVIVSNLALNKELESLRRANQELNNQIKQLKQ